MINFLLLFLPLMRIIVLLNVNITTIKVMAHLNHPKDEVVIQVLEFLSTLLYFCNKKAQEKIC